jgi:WhiB family redox-sensing transcriptional regulator
VLKPWQFEGASCSGLEVDYFFPENRTFNAENKLAKSICRTCVVKKECLDYAVAYSVQGIWGGTNNRERERIRKQLNIIPIPINEGKL